MNRTLFFIPVLIVGLFFLTYITLAHTINFLSVEEGYVIGEVSRWCERISDSYFRERANALSNLGFILTGLFMFWIISGETLKLHSRFHGPTPTAILYAQLQYSLVQDHYLCMALIPNGANGQTG